MLNKKNLIFLVIFVLAIASGLFFPKLFSTSSVLQPCYHGQVGNSNSLLQIIKQEAGDVTGELIFQNDQKDGSYGGFTGKFENNQLSVNFTFQSEGIRSVRQIIFTQDGELLEGEGFTYKPKQNCSSILYNQSLGLIPFDMRLPLYLFPQMRLQTISDEQLNYTFGPGGFKPIRSAKIEYTPSKGSPVDAVVFYLWQKSVWNVIANPNEAPDWGVMQWSDQANVFSVSGVQDCVYPNELDCTNITNIFNLIYDKNSYPNKVPKYTPAEVKVIKTKTFQDPETGYYVLSQFNILGISANQSYRCDLTVFNKKSEEIISWKTEGLSFSPNPSTIYSGQTNITPDQVPTVSTSTVKCEVADAIS